MTNKRTACRKREGQANTYRQLEYISNNMISKLILAGAGVIFILHPILQLYVPRKQ